MYFGISVINWMCCEVAVMLHIVNKSIPYFTPNVFTLLEGIIMCFSVRRNCLPCYCYVLYIC